MTGRTAHEVQQDKETHWHTTYAEDKKKAVVNVKTLHFNSVM